MHIYLQRFTGKLKLVFVSPLVLWLCKLLLYFILVTCNIEQVIIFRNYFSSNYLKSEAAIRSVLRTAIFESNYNPGQNISDKLTFLCEIAPYKRSSISIFQEFFANIDKILILGAGLSTRLQFYKVSRSCWYFLISLGSKSYVVWELVRQLVYTMFITNNQHSFHFRQTSESLKILWRDCILKKLCERLLLRSMRYE